MVFAVIHDIIVKVCCVYPSWSTRWSTACDKYFSLLLQMCFANSLLLNSNSTQQKPLFRGKQGIKTEPEWVRVNKWKEIKHCKINNEGEGRWRTLLFSRLYHPTAAVWKLFEASQLQRELQTLKTYYTKHLATMKRVQLMANNQLKNSRTKVFFSDLYI